MLLLSAGGGHDIFTDNLCPYASPTTSLRNNSNSISKYKERFDENGRPGVYGLYDRFGLYRGLDIYTHNNGADARVGRKEATDDDSDSDSSSSSSSSSISSGEYPPSYFEVAASANDGDNPLMHVIKQHRNETAMTGRSVQQHQAEAMASEERRQHEEDYTRMHQILDDIRAIMSRAESPEEELAQAPHHIGMIKAILSRYEECVCSETYRPSLLRKSLRCNQLPIMSSAMTAEEEEEECEGVVDACRRERKRRKKSHPTLADAAVPPLSPVPPALPSPNTTDAEYRVRVGSTDCYQCRLCDPMGLKEIKHFAWESHCAMYIHETKRNNDRLEKMAYGS